VRACSVAAPPGISAKTGAGPALVAIYAAFTSPENGRISEFAKPSKSPRGHHFQFGIYSPLTALVLAGLVLSPHGHLGEDGLVTNRGLDDVDQLLNRPRYDETVRWVVRDDPNPGRGD